ncbi:sperm acrosome membrane-associated protein 4 [Clupea harengus]|uniref:Sperm acrosome membrane-associated protein 4 n=1 Tax=Clupea harengus TaxID=7950 RepID=A0A6P3W1J8_CLUHA|nr:sperm acrosome membrane-associated protein 4 [Clupea harengus]
MNRIILSIFAVTVCFAVGHTLECYKCDLGLWDLCYTTKTTCTDGDLCYSGKGEAAKFVKIGKKGCLARAKCNMTESINWPKNSSSAIYTITNTCCDTDLCNAAPGLPRVGTLPLAIATLLTVITARAMV